jgi:hypothetical protein
MAQPYVTATYQDVSGEKSTVSIYLTDIQPDGTNYEAIIGDVASETVKIVNGIGALTACNLLSYSVTIPIFQDETPALPAHWVHRENKMLVSYQDDSNGRLYSFEVPGPDTAAFPVVSGDDFSVSTIEAALVAAGNPLHTLMLSRDGNDVTWRKARLVGRNI